MIIKYGQITNGYITSFFINNVKYELLKKTSVKDMDYIVAKGGLIILKDKTRFSFKRRSGGTAEGDGTFEQGGVGEGTSTNQDPTGETDEVYLGVNNKKQVTIFGKRKGNYQGFYIDNKFYYIKNREEKTLSALQTNGTWLENDQMVILAAEPNTNLWYIQNFIDPNLEWFLLNYYQNLGDARKTGKFIRVSAGGNYVTRPLKDWLNEYRQPGQFITNAQLKMAFLTQKFKLQVIHGDRRPEQTSRARIRFSDVPGPGTYTPTYNPPDKLGYRMNIKFYFDAGSQQWMLSLHACLFYIGQVGYNWQTVTQEQLDTVEVPGWKERFNDQAYWVLRGLRLLKK